MTLLALIPARGGSKGIYRKNIRSFYGKPLLQWSIDAALAAGCVDLVVVSTDDPEIAELAKACGALVPFLRPAELATDSAPGIAPVLHALELIPQTTDVLLLQPTSPLRTADDIESIVDLRQKAGSESAVSLTLSAKHPAWMYSMSQNHLLKPLLQVENFHCRQHLPDAYVLNGALYLASRDFLLREQTLVSAETIGYIMPADRSVDIDTLFDWRWAEFLMGANND